jgi:hypothetical protein
LLALDAVMDEMRSDVPELMAPRYFDDVESTRNTDWSALIDLTMLDEQAMHLLTDRTVEEVAPV